jgi:hypothetical protein
MAPYSHLTDKTESNKLQVVGQKRNRYLLKPRGGMKVTNISAVGHKRIEAVIEWAQGEQKTRNRAPMEATEPQVDCKEYKI